MLRVAWPPTACLSTAVGDALVGQVVDFLGRPYPLDGASSDGGAAAQHQQPAPAQHPEAAEAGVAGPGPAPIGGDATLPLLNGQPDMDSREQICEPLLTGVRVRRMPRWGGACRAAAAARQRGRRRCRGAGPGPWLRALLFPHARGATSARMRPV